MQYHIQTLVKHLFDKDSFEQVTVQELKQFTDDYPYAAVGQFLYAKKLKDTGSYNHYEQGEQTSLYFHNALWLRWQLDQKEEAPALPAKAEEPAQQPGFRIVVQMPKTAPAIITAKPATNQPEESKEEEPAINTPAASYEEATTEPVQPAAEDASAVPEEPVTEEHSDSLQVNSAGSLVEKAAAAAEQTPETASTVAIAEISQLAEESKPIEAAVNAVSITEEVLTPAAPAAMVKEDQDEIVPAVEVPAEMVDINTVKEEVDDIVPAVTEVDTNVEDIDDIVPAVEVKAETASEAPAIENQPVEAVIEPVAAAAQTITTERELPATVEEVVDNTTSRQDTAIQEEPVRAEPEPVLPQPEKATIDLGEPIFESYHTIDYFASQNIKLVQDDFKDGLGKQLKSFTDWLRSMKRIGPIESNTSLDEVTNQSIQRIAEHSVEEKEVLTEAMAEVWAKQGNTDKAIRVYEKLSLLNPAKSPYFASRIEQLKA